MRYFTLFLLSIFTLSLSAQEQEWTCKDPELLEALDHYIQSPTRTNEYTADYDIKYHRFEWTIDPAVRYIDGTVTTYFVPIADNFYHINFELDAALQVQSVSYHGQAVPFMHHQSEGRLEIDFVQLLPQGTLDSVVVAYNGVPPTSGFGSFRQATHGADQVPIISTLSEPYGAKDWWPCKQDLDDKIDSIDVIIRTPQQYRAATNGLLVSEVTDGNDKIYHWQHRYPIPAYLIAIGVTNYSVFTDYVTIQNGQEITLLNYLYPEQQAAIEPALHATRKSMVLFDSLFGTYPFSEEKYGHAQFDFGGGMEHQTMSFMGGWSFGLQAHELAHQWFGDKITCGSWQDIWLNEGFATYLTGLCYENGYSNYPWQQWKRDKINHITQNSWGSTFVYDTTSVSRIFSSRLTYSKAAMILHMLRWKLGDDDFFQGIYNYINDPGLEYDYAKTDDLKAHLEAQSGQNLDEFLADWLYGEGYPSYTITWWNTETTIGFQLDQATSHASVDFFEMPVPLLVRGANGEEQMIVLDHEFSGQLFERVLGFEPTEVLFDPELWIVSKNNEVMFSATHTEALEALSAKVRLFPNPVMDQLVIDLEDTNVKAIQLELWTESGQLLGQYPANDGITRIAVAHLPAGAYRLNVRTAAGSLVKSFIKI
jgi:aminopeptidase N